MQNCYKENHKLVQHIHWSRYLQCYYNKGLALKRKYELTK